MEKKLSTFATCNAKNILIMKIRFLSILLASLALATFSMTSCLNDDTIEVTYTNETSIIHFSVGTLWMQKTGQAQDGSDSLYMDTLSMSNYPFTIDQLNRTIENKDSLPVGTDISRVVTNINADSPYIVYGKIDSLGTEPVDTLWTNTDSINFAVAPSEGLTFKVMSYSGRMGKAYHIKINVHQQEPDSLTWDEEASQQAFVSQSLTRQKAVYTDGRIYVFGQDGDTPVIEYTTVSTNGQADGWIALDNVPQETDSYSAMVWNGTVYFLADGTLYELSGSVIQPSSLPAPAYRLKQLLANATTASGLSYLYAYTEDNRCVTYNGTSWSEDGEGSIFPDVNQRFSFASLPVSYNSTLTRAVVFGFHPDALGNEFGFAASRLNSENDWIVYDYAQADTFYCPNIADGTMIYYDKKLYAFGGFINSLPHKEYRHPFNTFFESTDNGLSWKPVTRYVRFPKSDSFRQKYEEGESLGEGSYSCVVDENNFIWIIWHNGYMSRGRINRLGFLPKW